VEAAYAARLPASSAEDASSATVVRRLSSRRFMRRCILRHRLARLQRAALDRTVEDAGIGFDRDRYRLQAYPANGVSGKRSSILFAPNAIGYYNA
jgi:hypothetical protein